MKTISMKGQVFGRLVVLKRSGSNSKREAMWLCRCLCGHEKTVSGVQLRAGNVRSCGCLFKQNSSERMRRLLWGKANFNQEGGCLEDLEDLVRGT